MSTTKKKTRPSPAGLDAAFAGLADMSSLLNADVAPPAPEQTGDKLKLEIARVHADPDQPRRKFDAAALGELADSISAQGVIQPIVVRPHPHRSDEWMIVAGERRWRASQLAGMTEIPAVKDDRAPSDRLLVQIVENVQRSDLDPIELVLAYGRLRDEYDLNATEIARSSGKSKQSVGEYLAVLDMPEPYRSALETGAVRDVSALNALWRKRERFPQQVTAMLAAATSDKPVTRALVRGIGENPTDPSQSESTAAVLSGEGSGAVGDAVAGTSSDPKQSTSATSEDEGAGQGDANGPASGAQAGEIAAKRNAAPADATLPVQIRVSHEGENYTVRYDKQRKVDDQVHVLLTTSTGVTLYAPLVELTVLEISRLQC